MWKKNKRSEALMTSLVNIFELPGEVLLDLPLITLTGRDILKIENYLTLGEFRDMEAHIATSVGEVVIRGEGLVLHLITGDTIEIRGRIYAVEYENRVRE